MANSDANIRLIETLGSDLRPVRRLAAPGWRALLWLAVVAAVAVAMVFYGDAGEMIRRFAMAPDLSLSFVGSALTAIAAAIAAFELGLPDRKPIWALLPLPPAVLWFGASGIGCFRSWLVPHTTLVSVGDAMDCWTFIVGMSLPLSAVLIVMLRRGYALQPVLTAAIGGLACAAAAATLLNFVHPFDASAIDLLFHSLAVGMVAFVIAMIGGRILRKR
ncbi:MAG TPA: NrsF family protein [Xanthobacteraceae bacterium]|nr:NrsF family protein [Xanthobacteraceae bacterium]